MSVRYPTLSRPSGLALTRALEDAGYDGPQIGFGIPGQVNAHQARAVNKRLALRAMADAGVSVPQVYDLVAQPWSAELVVGDINRGITYIGRRDHHRAGRGFFVCDTAREFRRTCRFRRPPTHYLRLIDVAREFRCHVVYGKSIKLQEKLGGEGQIRSFGNGWRYMFPQQGIDRRRVRAIAKQAIDALDLDFGAVDIVLDQDDQLYVLEVNTAPALTSASDTLGRYVAAFMEGDQRA